MRRLPLLAALLLTAACTVEPVPQGAGKQGQAVNMAVSDAHPVSRQTFYSVIDPQTGCEYLLSPGGHSDDVVSLRFDGNGRPMCPGTRPAAGFAIDRSK